MDRGGEIELSLLDQHHGGHARDRLGHRSNPEDCIWLQRHRLGAVAKADRSQVGDLAVARDCRNRARERAGIDLRLLPGGDPCQSRRRETERFRIVHRRGVVCKRPPDAEHDGEDRKDRGGMSPNRLRDVARDETEHEVFPYEQPERCLRR